MLKILQQSLAFLFMSYISTKPTHWSDVLLPSTVRQWWKNV